MGGEEFLLLLPDTNGELAADIAERLRASVTELHSAGLQITCSFGVATATGKDVAFAPLILEGDAALYGARRLGRNRVERAPGTVTSAPVFAEVV